MSATMFLLGLVLMGAVCKPAGLARVRVKR